MNNYKSVLKGTIIGFLAATIGVFLAALILYMTNATALFVGISSKLIIVVSAFLAGYVTGKLSTKRRFLWGMISGICVYVLVELITIMAGNFNGLTVGDLISITMYAVIASIGGMLS